MKKKLNMKYTLSYVYNHSIEKVWKVLKDVDLLERVDPNLKFEIKFLKKSCSWQVGSVYSITSINSFELIAKVKKIVEEKEFKQIQVKNKMIQPLQHDYYNTISLYYDTIQSLTMLLHEIEYEENFNPLFIEKMNATRDDFLKKINDYLNSFNDYFIQEESIVLEINRKCVWEIVSNWNIFKKLVPFIADDIKYEGDPQIQGTEVRLIWVTKKIECFLKVERVSIDKDSKIWEYSLLCYKGVPAVPEQEIIFKIVRIDKNYTFLEFKHIFKHSIRKEVLEITAQNKKKILQTLKEKISKLKLSIQEK